MIEEEKALADESRRVADHESVKSEVRGQVNSAIAEKAARVDTTTDEARAEVLAGRFKQKAFTEVVQTENEIERARGMARIAQIIDYVFYLIYGVIILDIVLDLAGARASNPFKHLLDSLTAPLLSWFKGLLNEPSKGPYQLKLSYIVGLIVIIMVHLAIKGLLRLIAERRTVI